jgi:hypothetical protein
VDGWINGWEYYGIERERESALRDTEYIINEIAEWLPVFSLIGS